MAYHQHHHRQRDIASDRKTLLLRVMSALIGLTFGFAGGKFFAAPLRLSSASASLAGAPGAAPVVPALGAPLEERVAAAVLMDEDALQGVLAAAHDDWVLGGSRAEGAPLAMLRLRMIFSRWTDLNGNSALRATLNLRDAGFGDMALESLMLEWGLRDPLAASQTITLIPWTGAQQRALAALIRAGVQRSPAEGLAFAAKINLVPQDFLRRVAGAEWMRRDASHALRFLLEETGMKGSVPAGAALGQWLLEDPAAFMAWRKAEPGVFKTIPLLRFPAEVLTPGRLTRLITVLRGEFGSLEAAFTWLRASGGSGVETVIAAIAPPLPAAEAEMKSWQGGASARPGAGTTDGWLARLAHARFLEALTSCSDPAAALTWLAALPREEEAERLAPALARRWIAAAPESATSQLFSRDLANPVHRAAANTVVNRIVLSDPLKSLDGLGSLPLDPAAAAVFRATALQRLAAGNPAAMLDWLAAHPNVKAPAGDLSRALLSLAATDAPRAVAWVRKQANATESNGLIAGIFGVWLKTDRTESLKFLQSLPVGSERDQAITQLVSSDSAVTDPFFAGNMLPDTFGHTLQYSDDAGRLAALRSLLLRMGQLKISSETSLKNPALRPADRAALLKNP